MRKHLLLSFVPMTIAVAAAGPPSPVHADESSKPDHAMLLASNAPGMQHGVGFGIVTVSAPQPLPAGRTSVTLWDEIPRRPSCRCRSRYRSRATCSTRWKAPHKAVRTNDRRSSHLIRMTY